MQYDVPAPWPVPVYDTPRPRGPAMCYDRPTSTRVLVHVPIQEDVV